MKKWIAMFAVICGVLTETNVLPAQYWDRTAVATGAAWEGEVWIEGDPYPCLCFADSMSCTGGGDYRWDAEWDNGSDSAGVSTPLGSVSVGPSYFDTWLNYAVIDWNMASQATTGFSGLTAGGWISKMHINGDAGGTRYTQNLSTDATHELVSTSSLTHLFDFSMTSVGSDLGLVSAYFCFDNWKGELITIEIGTVGQGGSLATYVDDFDEYTEDYFTYNGGYALGLQSSVGGGPSSPWTVTYAYAEEACGGQAFGTNVNDCYQELDGANHSSSHNFSIISF